MLAPSIAMAKGRAGGLVAVFCAVFGGAAMLTGALVLTESGITSHLAPERLAGADLLVAAEQRVAVAEDMDIPLPDRNLIDAETADLVAAVNGVDVVAPDLSFPAALVVQGNVVPGSDPAGAGHGWDATALSEPDLAGAAPAAPDEVVIDDELAAASGLATGDSATVITSGEAGEFLVTGTVDVPGHGMYFHDATAPSLAGRTDATVDLIAVQIQSGADTDQVAADIEAALEGTGLRVVTGEAIGDAESLIGGGARSTLIMISGSLGGTLLLLVAFIVAGALSVSVAGQRRELALMRAVGATPKQVRRLIANQAMTVTLLAIPGGAVLGYALADSLVGLLVDAGMVPSELPIARSPLPAVAAAVLLVIAAQIAARAASRRTSRIPATEAVAETRVEPRSPGRVRIVIGVVLIGSAFLMALVPLFSRRVGSIESASAGTLVAIVGLGLAGPALVRVITGSFLRRLRSGAKAPIWMAFHNSHAYALRTAGAITVLALAVAFAMIQVSSQGTITAVADADLEAGSHADSTVTGGAIGGVPSEDVADIASLPGVDAAVPLIATTVVSGDEPSDPEEAITYEAYPSLALGAGAAAVVDLGVTEGDLDDLTGDTVAIDEGTAMTQGLGIGDQVDLILGDGSAVAPTVVAVFERNFGFGSFVVSTDLAAGPDGRYDAVLISGDGAAVTEWAAGRPGLEHSDGAAAAGLDAGKSDESFQWINIAVTLALLGYVLLGVGNSLVATTSRRRSELAGLRLIGATPAQIRSMMRRETAVMIAIAVGAGLAITVVPMTLLSIGLLGEPRPQGPLWVIPAISAVVALIAYAAVMVPTGKALGEAPTRALLAD